MSDVREGFDNRLRRIERRHSNLSRGYVARIGRDGLIELHPRRGRRAFPWRGALFLVVGFLVFKGIIMANLGDALYQERIAALRDGAPVEQVGAFIMQPDPVSQAVAAKLIPLFW